MKACAELPTVGLNRPKAALRALVRAPRRLAPVLEHLRHLGRVGAGVDRAQLIDIEPATSSRRRCQSARGSASRPYGELHHVEGVGADPSLRGHHAGHLGTGCFPLAVASVDPTAPTIAGRLLRGRGAPAYWRWVRGLRAHVESSDPGALRALDLQAHQTSGA